MHSVGDCNHVSTLGRHDRKKRRNQVKELTRSQLRRSSGDKGAKDTAIAKRDRISRANIKKILLTRKYHDTNIYNDIGIRVIGGKKLPNGELAAFVSDVNRRKAREILNEIKEAVSSGESAAYRWITCIVFIISLNLGDRVLEWNGVILTGKTFEEVEQVIAASRGEIEVVIASNPISNMEVASNDLYGNKGTEEQKSKRERKDDETRDHSQKSEAPPVPAHRCVDGKTSLCSDSYATLKPSLNSKTASLQLRNNVACVQQSDTLGYLNVALSYDRLTSTLMVTVLSAKNLAYRQYCNTTFYPNPFVKVYLLPGRKVSDTRRTKFVSNTSDPVWDQTLEYTVPFHELYSHYLEFTVWDYDKLNDDNALGKLVISLSDPYILDGTSRWYPLHPTDNDLAVLGLSSPEFQRTIGTINGFTLPHYNPTYLDITCPTI
ncbi:unnamed protein product [Litomosoides sigmodontis]|uniref:C2 domain-containing protein n=1 Tax=Litomosoides sigmodontis TaxID=42156 RepID=A0A3P6SV04_LITSI|nr:unnamed protein product [Litomosoides sigmodontis]